MPRQRCSRISRTLMPNHPRLDQYAALATMTAEPQHSVSTPTMPTGAPATAPADADASGLVRERPDLGGERLRFGCTATALPNPPRSDLKIIVAHDIVGDRCSDGAENGVNAPFRSRRASKGDDWMALESLIFCPSPPQPTARLLSCHLKLPFHSSEPNFLHPSPIHDQIRHTGKSEIIANGPLKQVRKGRQAGAEMREAESEKLSRPRHRASREQHRHAGQKGRFVSSWSGLAALALHSR